MRIVPRQRAHTPHALHRIRDDVRDHVIVPPDHVVDAVRCHKLLAVESRAGVRGYEAVEGIAAHPGRGRGVRGFACPGDVCAPRGERAGVRSVRRVPWVRHQAAVEVVVGACFEELYLSAHGFFGWGAE